VPHELSLGSETGEAETAVLIDRACVELGDARLSDVGWTQATKHALFVGNARELFAAVGRGRTRFSGLSAFGETLASRDSERVEHAVRARVVLGGARRAERESIAP
jgi:hypothetical protein